MDDLFVLQIERFVNSMFHSWALLALLRSYEHGKKNSVTFYETTEKRKWTGVGEQDAAVREAVIAGSVISKKTKIN